jgi:predicted GIY-YIG superfamily endonuclease
MKSFPFTSPPDTCGVYAIRHKAKRQYYIGSSENLRRRWMNWWLSLNDKKRRNELVARAFKGSTIEDWDFVVLHEAPSIAEARRLEHQAIQRLLHNKSIELLNRAQVVHTAPVGRPRLVTIFDHTGVEIGTDVAAAQLGINVGALYARLNKLRQQGITKTTVFQGKLTY